MHWIRCRGFAGRRLTCSLGGSAMAISPTLKSAVNEDRAIDPKGAFFRVHEEIWRSRRYTRRKVLTRGVKMCDRRDLSGEHCRPSWTSVPVCEQLAFRGADRNLMAAVIDPFCVLGRDVRVIESIGSVT